MGVYREVYERSLTEPESFWAEAAAALDWDRRWDRVLNFDRPPFYRWFEGGMLNTCFNAVDRHVAAGRADQLAIIHDSPMAGSTRRITYGELKDLVSRFAGVLTAQGVAKGDRVIIYMPMVPEAAVAMLACARIGAIHSVVFGGFAARELGTRIDDAKPVLIVSASCGIEPNRVVPYMPLLDEAIRRATHKPARCIVLQRPQALAVLDPDRDLDWEAAMAGAKPVGCTPVQATDPLYILYTSGTTGLPKGIVRDNGGHATALLWSMKHIYGIQPGEVFWTASDVGWVVGHSYIVYAPLLNGSTTVIYEGKPVGTPDAGAFWRVIAEHGVKVLFTAPTAFRAIRREDPDAELMHRYALGEFRALFLAGERCDPETLRWAEEKLSVPVIDHWWQTETGWAIAANYLGIEQLPVKPGSPTLPAPGYDVRIMDDDGHELPPGGQGAICIRLPLPPACLASLWGGEERFVQGYMSRYPGHYLTGDAGHKDEDGYLFVMGRIDDVINVAGHRLSTGQIEEVLAAHSAVAECAVMGVADSLKGELPVGFLVLKAGVTTPAEEVEREAVAMVRAEIGPVAAFKMAKVVKRLPKTRSGKILRGTMKKIADGTPWTMPATIDDPKILEEITAALQQLGYARTS
ncbi:MAG TPA: propionyl-CoA synthetase [Geminicoccus sp.]|jgi:propionyl-CoA synthetase|uniref:propionyl-CoA synthetase n=1 Tax=Geminicoccus sp. TaxID=2024832 RepID=UPI002E2FEE8D|nr:propionyl-CoA synthetase [Geminicoccus sp.]HEX2527387.1 propionyl-CoA synthetase [Geminicoccus sp.]